MKTLKTCAERSRSKTLLTFAILLLSFSNTKAQDDLSGWYADDVKVDKLTCYSFQSLKIVFLYNPEWSQYEFIKISIDKAFSNGRIDGQYGRCEKVIPTSSLNSYMKGKYIVYIMIGKENQSTDLKYRAGKNEISVDPGDFSKGEMRYEIGTKKGKQVDDLTFMVQLIGLTFESVKEEYKANCKCIKKTNLYTPTNLSKTYSLTCTNREGGTHKEAYETIDLTTPCTYTGAKVDFNTLK